MPNILGIDLGTTNTSASLILDKQDPIRVQLSTARDPYLMRSAALKLGPESWLAGDAAREYAQAHPETNGSLMTAFKPLLMLPERGQTRWKAVNVEGELRNDPIYMGTVMVGGGTHYVLAAESRTSTLCAPGTSVADVRRATQEMLTAVFGKVKSAYPRLVLDNLVIGVPIGFPDVGKAKIIDAAADAGIVATRRQIALFPEPIAVALAYGIEHRTPKRVLVFDHGGGTLDLTIVDIEGHPNGDFAYRVLAQDGHDRAGRYYDRLVLARILHEHSRGQDALRALRMNDPMAVATARYLDEAERVKETLFPAQARRSQRQVRFTQNFDDVMISQEVTEAWFSDVIKDELDTVRTKLQSVIEQAEARGVPIRGRGTAGVQEVLMAGGSALIPAMRQVIEAMFPGVSINSSYAGSRTTTAGFARAVQYRKLIDELTDTEYSFYEPAQGRPIPVLKLGTPIADTAPAVQKGSPGGYYIQSEDGNATVLTFATGQEKQHLVLQSEVHAKRGEAVQVMLTVDRDTGLPQVEAMSCETGAPLPVLSVQAGNPGLVPIIECGQVIQFTGNQMPNYQSHGVGCIERIVRIRDAVSSDMAIGHMESYRLVMHHPDGSSVHVRTKTGDIKLYDIPLPRPGQTIELQRLSAELLVSLKSSPIYQFERIERPAALRVDVQEPVTSQPVQAEEFPSAAPEQPVVADTPPQQRRRRVIGDRLLDFLKGKPEKSGT